MNSLSKLPSNWILFMTKRIMRSRRKSRRSVTAILSIISLAAGITTLIAVISIMNGFQLGTIEDLIELNSFHIRIQSPDLNTIGSDIEELKSLKGVSTAFPLIEIQGLVRGVYRGPQSVLLKAVDPNFFQDNIVFSQRISLSNSGQLGENEVILGRELARFLGVGPGDSIRVISLVGENIDLSNPLEIELRVTGFFASGYYEFDRNWAFMNIHSAESRLGAGYRKEIALKIDDRNRDLEIMNRIIEAGLDRGSIESWRQFNRSIFGALRIEKTLMTFLIGLIFLVVGVNIFQALRRTVHERFEDIAVLKVLGASNREIKLVFVFEGILVAVIATIIGLPSGILISLGINEIFGFVEKIIMLFSQRTNVQILSQQFFYLQEVPVHFFPSEIIGILIAASLSAILSAYFATSQITKMHPREVFTNE